MRKPCILVYWKTPTALLEFGRRLVGGIDVPELPDCDEESIAVLPNLEAPQAEAREEDGSAASIDSAGEEIDYRARTPLRMTAWEGWTIQCGISSSQGCSRMFRRSNTLCRATQSMLP
ncbi:MAG: hypothetical protein R3C12_12395 [Planctomycetaceae bacterium]